MKQTNTAQPLYGSLFYTMAQRIIDDADPAKGVQFRLTPVNGALSGMARTTDAVVMTP